MAMKKKAAAPEPAGESAPMWIVSFADLVTLMMSFFVVLYALKQGGEQQQMETTVAIKSTFGWKPDMYSDADIDRVGRKFLGVDAPPFEDKMGKSKDEDKGAKGTHNQVETIRAGNDVVAGGKIIFEAGQTTLTATSRDTIRQIADKVRGHNNILFVKGHVSADEVATHPEDQDAMGLSYRRSLVVVEELVRLGIDRRVLRPTPCGPFEPVKTGVYDQKDLQFNRRVEVYSTDATASEFFPIQTVPATTERVGAPAAMPHEGHHG